MQTLRLQNFPSYLQLIQKQVQLVILCTNFRHVYIPNRILGMIIIVNVLGDNYLSCS